MSGNGSYVNNDDHQFYLDAPFQKINERFDMTQGFAEQYYGLAQGYVNDLANIQFIPPSTDDITDVPIPGITGIDYIKRPTVGDLNLDLSWPNNDAQLTPLSPLPPISSVDLPTPTFSPPSWTPGEKPELSAVAGPGEPPVTGDVAIPAAPSLPLPAAPTFSDVVLPSPPEIAIPLFDAALPEVTLDEPKGFSFSEKSFSSDVANSLKVRLIHDLVNGGTGLEPLVEQGMIDRAIYRQQVEDDKLYQQIDQEFASRNHPLPAGAHAARLAEAAAEISRNDTELNGKIFIEQAQLAQKNTHFIIESGHGFFQTELDFHNAQANRALEGAKQVALVGIELFNARVNKYNAEVQTYKTQADVFETRVKAALAGVEVFKAQIEAANLSLDAQKLTADLYNSQLAAIETSIKIYVAEMEGAKIASEVEQSKLETFRLKTQAYIAQLEGEKIKFDVYATELSGEKVKADVYESQVRGFLGEVEAVKAIAGLDISKAELTLKQNDQKIDKYKADLATYVSEIDTKTKKVSAQVSGFEAEVSAYGAETAAEGSFYDAKSKEMTVHLANAEVRLRKAIADVEASVSGYVALKGLEVEAGKGITQTTAQLAASALQAVNTSLSQGYSANESRDESWSHSDALQETHSFDETPT